MIPLSRLAAVSATLVICGVTAIAAQERGPDRLGGPGAVMERFDTDGDGVVTRAEVDAAQAARFAEADLNGDGALSLDELIAAQEARRLARQTAQAQRLLAWLDQDGDGVVSAEEMAQLAGRRGDIFERLDRDADGTITLEEVEQARALRRGGGRPWFGKRVMRP
ncbi:MAG: EF-hand domain-containing protein [Pseudomonadota bacterium]